MQHHDYPQKRLDDSQQSDRATGADLQAPEPSETTHQHPERQYDDTVALVLIAVGIVALFGRFLPPGLNITGGMVLLTLSSIFLFFAFWRHIYGLLIPGCILAGLSVGVPLAAFTDGVSVLWGLSLGFFAILLFGRLLFRVASPWPVYPAVVLFGVGIVVIVSNVPVFLASSMFWVPLLLIGVGLYLGLRRRNS
jgi:hypothetical protein